MKLIKNIQTMRKLSKDSRLKGKTIAFVPTMGCLHSGHLSLIRKAVKDCDLCVLSIYVNPLQFGPKEDFNQYPRNLKNDLVIAKHNKVDYVFAPDNHKMYPQDYLTSVSVDKITGLLCGLSRPGHFKGVATVVNKLFNIVMPDIAYFGQKDFQQALIIKKMVQDLNIGIKIKILPIVREKDGLAMSSRNIYLSSSQRQDAIVVYRSLQAARAKIISGEKNVDKLVKLMKNMIEQVKSAKIDYLSIVDADDLSKKKEISGKVLIALAVFIGKIRLIDNIVLNKIYR
ncbi:MAG: pantoate--beta-alanine ligase [Candidatus Omnitrophota bacterium]|nr:MAG: pantoate--beta-alanine ligase [Candidatus Omnitrophota bacterium]